MKFLSSIKSTALRSEFLVLGEEAEIEEQDEYFVVRSPQNPLFYWGNFLIFKHPPEVSDIPRWEKIFCKEFPDSIYHHRAFAWMYGNINEDFPVSGYSLERSVCLMTKTVRKVPQINPEVTVRKIKPSEWPQIEMREIALDQSENNSGPSFLLNYELKSINDFWNFKRETVLLLN